MVMLVSTRNTSSFITSLVLELLLLNKRCVPGRSTDEQYPIDPVITVLGEALNIAENSVFEVGPSGDATRSRFQQHHHRRLQLSQRQHHLLSFAKYTSVRPTLEPN
jgi:hypothetical protein